MRSTWDVLSNLKESKKFVKNLGLYNLEIWKIESLTQPSPPIKVPTTTPIANYFTMSPWRSESSLVQFCHSRAIECLVKLNWDPKNSVVGKPLDDEEIYNIDKIVKHLVKTLDDRELMQILTLWATNRGLVIFPTFPLPDALPKDPAQYDAWRVDVSTKVKNLR